METFLQLMREDTNASENSNASDNGYTEINKCDDESCLYNIIMISEMQTDWFLTWQVLMTIQQRTCYGLLVLNCRSYKWLTTTSYSIMPNAMSSVEKIGMRRFAWSISILSSCLSWRGNLLSTLAKQQQEMWLWSKRSEIKNFTTKIIKIVAKKDLL